MPCSAENRTAERERDFLDGVRQFPSRQELGLGHVDQLGDVVVDVAVAEMADRQRSGAGTQAEYPRLGAGDEVGNGGDRHRDVVLDIAAFALLCEREGVAQPPEVAGLRQRAGERGII